MPSYHATCSAASFNILISALSVRRLSIASAVNRPCLSMPFALPLGAPGDAPPCMRHLPFGIAGARHGLRLRVLAPQRGLRCMGEGLCMGLSAIFLLTPTPSGCSRDVADHSLPALVDSHV